MNTQRRHDESRESNELPGLVKAYSTSSSSHTSGSPSKSSQDVSIISRRLKKRGNKKGHHGTVSEDSSILRGAEILRRQLLHTDDIDDDEALLGPENYGNIDKRKIDYPGAREPQEDYVDDDVPHPSSDEWSDPWSELNADLQVEEGAIVPRTGLRAEPTEEAFDFPAQEDAANWAYISDSEEEENDDDTDVLLQRASQSLPSPRSVSPDHTHESFMGRDRNLRTKVQTYLVQRVDEMDNSTFASSYSSSYQPTQFEGGDMSYLPGGLLHSPEPKLSTLGPPPGTTRGSPYFTAGKSWDDQVSASDSHSHALNLLKDLQCEEALQDQANEQEELAYFLEATKRDPNVFMMTLPTEELSPCDSIVSPQAPHYDQLMRDPAFLHAQRAGILWQSLVSQHVRFSSKWWNGARAPPMGVAEPQMWNYTGRHRVKGNRLINGLVRNRGSTGQLLLHIIVRDIMTLDPVQDISIGCFHPNARGVRRTPAFDPFLEDCRDIWLALRRRGDDASVVESLLKRQHDDDGDASPLGGKHDVDNSNMRAVFGEAPPVQTVFVVETELYELFSQHLDGKLSPSAVLLQRFLPGW
jgi:hypothetical protein